MPDSPIAPRPDAVSQPLFSSSASPPAPQQRQSADHELHEEEPSVPLLAELRSIVLKRVPSQLPLEAQLVIPQQSIRRQVQPYMADTRLSEFLDELKNISINTEPAKYINKYCDLGQEYNRLVRCYAEKGQDHYSDKMIEVQKYLLSGREQMDNKLLRFALSLKPMDITADPISFFELYGKTEAQFKDLLVLYQNMGWSQHSVVMGWVGPFLMSSREKIDMHLFRFVSDLDNINIDVEPVNYVVHWGMARFQCSYLANLYASTGLAGQQNQMVQWAERFLEDRWEHSGAEARIYSLLGYKELFAAVQESNLPNISYQLNVMKDQAINLEIQGARLNYKRCLYNYLMGYQVALDEQLTVDNLQGMLYVLRSEAATH